MDSAVSEKMQNGEVQAIFLAVCNLLSVSVGPEVHQVLSVNSNSCRMGQALHGIAIRLVRPRPE